MTVFANSISISDSAQRSGPRAAARGRNGNIEMIRWVDRAFLFAS
jgi:hypothetical protein